MPGCSSAVKHGFSEVERDATSTSPPLKWSEASTGPESVELDFESTLSVDSGRSQSQLRGQPGLVHDGLHARAINPKSLSEGKGGY